MGVAGSGSAVRPLPCGCSQVNADLATLSYSNANPGSDTITMTTVDGDGSTVTKNIAVTVKSLAGPPVLGSAGNTVNWSQGQAATAIDSAITVSDNSSPTLTGATIAISAGYHQDNPPTNQNGITGTYNAGRGILTLSGTASLAAYQEALESVTFSSLNPTGPTRTITWTAQSGGLSSSLVTSTIDVGQTHILTTGNDTTAVWQQYHHRAQPQHAQRGRRDRRR